ncbi:MAG TPA: acetyl-CoA carboxylase biotin carboxyl carrier protein [Bryobacteraceae bacterium]|jgi:acetyl-CoA carboxylase biotin carboxyl carrier protein|nr:acetyl-CoA carboxylase biotin carboxyl carrier protein [Bryobacteraceae bacterium]
MSIDEIRELIGLVSETGVAELEVQRGENRVRIRRTFGADEVRAQEFSVPAAAASPTPTKPETPPAKPDEELVYAKSPIVGTFYEAPSPDKPPFVQIGDRVTPGKVLCIIEAMKLMNPIEAEVSGVIESRLVQNEQPVGYGELLFGIRPV